MIVCRLRPDLGESAIMKFPKNEIVGSQTMNKARGIKHELDEDQQADSDPAKRWVIR